MKSKTVAATVVGPIPHHGFGDRVLWKVRLKAPRFPFYIDSSMCYQKKAQADAVAEKWRKRKITISIA